MAFQVAGCAALKTIGQRGRGQPVDEPVPRKMSLERGFNEGATSLSLCFSHLVLEIANTVPIVEAVMAREVET